MATEETKANVENEEQKAQQKAEPQTKQDKKKQDKKGFEARIEALEKEKKELEEKAAEAADARLRLMAEFENFRRRNTQEKLDLVATAAKDTIEGLLPILDDCERALKALASSEDSAAAKEGTELIYSKLMAYLKSKGLEPIDAIGRCPVPRSRGGQNRQGLRRSPDRLRPLRQGHPLRQGSRRNLIFRHGS
ncbi:MAG: nucleotide exchange factor GrpE [Bacteroidales bacterium]|nr:nucleotide exchange factor GrpE [Bacteroidales bacterium]